MEQHNRIINRAARNILKPEGLFQKGSSRIWLDDNDYFITQVEFQPSAFCSGSYLNVAVSFLWEYSEKLDKTLAFHYGGRVCPRSGPFAEYTDDETFAAAMESFAGMALEQVKEYRSFKDLDWAKRTLTRTAEDSQDFWESYDLSMLCFLKGDFQDGTAWFSRFMGLLKNTINTEPFPTDWCRKLHEDCQRKIVPRLMCGEEAQSMVFEMINRRRAFFQAKTSYRGMKKGSVFSQAKKMSRS